MRLVCRISGNNNSSSGNDSYGSGNQSSGGGYGGSNYGAGSTGGGDWLDKGIEAAGDKAGMNIVCDFPYVGT